MDLTEKKTFATQLLTEVIAETTNLFIVEVAVKPFRNGILINAFIDTDTGISLEECSAVSRAYGKVLEEQPAFEQLYRLDVSSPGVDRPLIPRQLPRCIGKNLLVIDLAGLQHVGKLLSVAENTFTLALRPTKKKSKEPLVEMSFNYPEIKEVKVTLT